MLSLNWSHILPKITIIYIEMMIISLILYVIFHVKQKDLKIYHHTITWCKISMIWRRKLIFWGKLIKRCKILKEIWGFSLWNLTENVVKSGFFLNFCRYFEVCYVVMGDGRHPNVVKSRPVVKSGVVKSRPPCNMEIQKMFQIWLKSLWEILGNPIRLQLKFGPQSISENFSECHSQI